MVIFGVVKLEKDKTQIVFISFIQKAKQNVKWEGEVTEAKNGVFLVRESLPSL